MTRREIVCAVALVAFVLGTATHVHAQASLEVPLQFDLLNPGARSLAMGSAFAGLADDATAAFTNPAGLMQLLKPEASIEIRYRRGETPYLTAGRLSGTPTGIGIDTIAGPVYANSIDATTVPSYLSFVYPTKRWAIAGYRHSLIDIDAGFQAQGVFQQVPGVEDPDPELGTIRELPLDAVRQITIVNYGFAAAFRVNDKFTIGGGLSVYDFSIDSRFSRFLFQTGIEGQPAIFSPPDYSNEQSRNVQQGDDMGVGGSVGIQWAATTKLQIGAVVRRGPGFDFTAAQVNPISKLDSQSGTFKVPDAFSVGLKYRASEPFTVAMDYSFVKYSQLEDDYVHIQAGASQIEQFQIDDANEFHFGAEYQWLSAKVAPSVRGGLWFDPNHSINYIPNGKSPLADERFAAYFASGKDLWHYTFGGGAALSRRFEANVGVDLSSRTRVVSASAVVRF
jgi:long-chain fatty acid transport protein